MKKYKYITINANSVSVKIERGGAVFDNSFRIRRYDSLDDALQEAIQWRDKKHLEVFGYPVTKNKIVLRKIKTPDKALDPKTGEELPDLPPGLSYGFHRGRLLYVVVSYQENSKPKRVRVPIKGQHINIAIDQANKIRMDKARKTDSFSST